MSSWRGRLFSAFVRLVSHNWITVLGSTLVTVCAVLIIGLIILGSMGVFQTAYLGILAFLILPAGFVFGLVVIPCGVYWERFQRRRRGLGEEPPLGPYPVLDFSNPHTREVALVVAGLTFLNLLIVGTVTYKGVEYMDSPQFCGQVCHTVMQPEFTAYSNSPHSRVRCVDCHIGPGASWFVKSKMSGLRQVFATALDTYERPIATPVHNLRPSKETCEQCHWPAKFTGDRIRLIPTYQEDETNSQTYSVLLMHIGGGHGAGHGIHSWHIDPSKKTTYLATDEERQKIDVVRVTDTDGKTTQYKMTDSKLTDAEIEQAVFRTMDCIDCHNRPTHILHLPGRAVDEQMALGAIDATLPYIKQEAVAALNGVAEKGGASDDVAQFVRDAYQKDHPDVLKDHASQIDAAVEVLKTIYSQNVFPKMKVTWGTYPTNLGHADFPGCFRCHDDSHKSADGNSVISQDCDLCHTVLAWDEAKPAILDELQLH